MAESSDGSDSFAEWSDFALRHEGHRFLRMGTLHALTLPLIEAIKAEIPGFFSDVDLAFERDLVETASFGFFHRRALGKCTRPGSSGAERQNELDRRSAASKIAIEELLAQEEAASGVSQSDFDESQDLREGILERQRDIDQAFIGWLVTNQEFGKELNDLRHRWGDVVRKIACFPRTPCGIIEDPTEEMNVPSDFRIAMFEFYLRWGLSGMSTWEMPVPLKPDLGTSVFSPAFRVFLDSPVRSKATSDLIRSEAFDVTTAGVLVFVPWHLVARRNAYVQIAIPYAMSLGAPTHLAGWVDTATKPSRNLGLKRYQCIYEVWRFLGLALVPRHAKSCHGKLGNLDRVLGRMLGGRNEETIRKARQELGGWIKTNEQFAHS